MTQKEWATAAFDTLAARCTGDPWLQSVAHLAQKILAEHRHGDLPRWLSALDRLPAGLPCLDFDDGVPNLGQRAEDPGQLREVLMELHPWRKGPLRLGGLEIDTEWRSDWKWERLAPHLDLSGRRILDIGCGNGYYGLRMLEAGAKLIVGIDPTLLFVMQWLACRHFSGDLPNYVLPMGIEDLPQTPAAFDLVFSMGVIYHRKDPLEHLQRIHSLLRPGGTMVLETLVLPPGSEQQLLCPKSRYAAMRNVWAIPAASRLATWVSEAGFSDPRLADLSVTTLQEQRSTDWMRFESLEQALDPEDPSRTREGHPAPVRAIMLSRK